MSPHEQLEQEWAAFNELDPAGMVVCSSGTAALHLALEALQLPRGSTVAIPDFTFVSCARAASLAGLAPAFVDCDERLCMDPQQVRGDLMKLRAVMPVHIYGRRCSMDELGRRAVAFDLRLIEDLAQAHGVRPHTDTDAACWSFHSSKIVHGEEGGAVWFRDPARAVLARCLRSCGQEGGYRHTPRGHNYRLADCLASLILGSLRCYGENVCIRRELEGEYDALCPAELRMPERNVPWMYDVRVPGLTWERQYWLVQQLVGCGVHARHAFKPMTLQREYKQITGNVGAWRASKEVIVLELQSSEHARKAFEVLSCARS